MLIQKRAIRALFGGAILSAAICAGAQAPLTTYTDIHDFGAKVNGPQGPQQYDGSVPDGRLTFDINGNLYGTSTTGGYSNAGSVWEINTAGVYKVLHNFGGMVINASGVLDHDGSHSYSPITFDASGNLYGTTNSGGTANKGMVWEITKAGTYLDLHDFQATKVLLTTGKMGLDGANPVAGVTIDSSGNLWGVAPSGGAATAVTPDSGILWEITKAGVYQDVHDFGLHITYTYGSQAGLGGSDGYTPTSEVHFDKAGTLWGTTSDGGYYGGNAYGAGTLYTLTTSGVYTDVYDFGENGRGEFFTDGNAPSGIVFDASNNIYGTAQGGNTGYGIVWKFTTAGQLQVLHTFEYQDFNQDLTITLSNGQQGLDAGNPGRDVAMDSQGNLFGTCNNGAIGESFNPGGDVWEITQSGVFTDIHDFGPTKVSQATGGTTKDGAYSQGGIALDQYGNLYGTTTYGGETASNSGTVWTIGWLHLLSLSPGSVGAGSKATGSVLLTKRAPIGGTIINLATSDANAALSTSQVKIAANDYIATFTVSTARVTSADTVTVSATQMFAAVSQNLVINPATIAGFSYFNGPKGGSTATISVDLTAPAPAGGLTVSLSSNSASATVPATVVVPAGATSASFTATYGTVTSATPVVITGTVGTVSATAKITINP